MSHLFYFIYDDCFTPCDSFKKLWW